MVYLQKNTRLYILNQEINEIISSTFCLEFLHWKGYSANNSSNNTHYKHGQSQDRDCQGCSSHVENDLSNYRQFDALTTLPRKNRSTQKESFNRFSKDKGEFKYRFQM